MTDGSSSEAGPRAERRAGISFLVVATTVFLSGTWVACATWEHFWGTRATLGCRIAPYLLTLMFIVSLLAGMRFSSPLVRLAYGISAVWLGLLNFFLFAAFGCWVTYGVVKVGGFGLTQREIAAALYGMAVLAGGYGIVNAAWLRVTRVSVRLPHLPAAWHGREVVLVSDLHLGNVRRARFMRKVVRRIMSLKPYAVFISGDLFDGPKADYDALVAPGRELSAIGGVYYVTGNHEEFTDRAKYIAAVQRAGLRVLNNEKVTVEGLQIIGVHDAEAEEPEVFRKVLRDAAVDRQRASILLSHRPAHLTIPEEAGISLQVSGHTHKGQNWPWNWVIYQVHGPFAYGLNRLGQLLVLTSSGAGTWGPPMRVGTKSELVLIRLERAADQP